MILLATVLTALLLGPTLARRIVWTQTDVQIAQVRESLAQDDSLTTLSDAFTRVSEVVEPSVVHVQVFGESATTGGMWRRFDPLTPLGSGSGWVYRHQPQGGGEPADYIITNAHVIRDAAEIRVRFSDGSQHEAKLLHADDLTDVAVLQIDTVYLHPAAISLVPVRKGEIVFAFGSPFRFDFSVSQGIVSASGRRLDISNRGKYENFIQTDAAINPGNSGGPLTDIHGRVVGMNTAIARNPVERPDEFEGFVGLGFAIPVQMVVDVAERIIADGQVRRGYLGVFISDLSPAMARSFDYRGSGVLVEHPQGGGPGADAGLVPGDIITRVGDEAVATAEQLRYLVSTFPPEDTIALRIVRGGQERDLPVTLGELPQASGPGVYPAMPAFDLRPQRTDELDNTALREAGIELISPFGRADARAAGFGPVEGVLILDVRPSSRLGQQGVSVGQIITAVQNQPVDSPETLRKLVDAAAADQPVRLTTVRWDPVRREYITRFALVKE